MFRKRWHIFEHSTEFFKNSKEVAKELLSPSTAVNESVPLGCDEALAFIVDTTRLKYESDLTCDETGKYKKPSTSKCEITVDEKENISGYTKGHDKSDSKVQRFTLVRRYFTHRDTPSFHRTVYELQRNNVRVHPIVIVRYEWRGEKTTLNLTPHGNSKHNKEPFIRSKKRNDRRAETNGRNNSTSKDQYTV